MMFVSNIRAVFLKKLNQLSVLLPYHNTNEYRNTGNHPGPTMRSKEHSKIVKIIIKPFLYKSCFNKMPGISACSVGMELLAHIMTSQCDLILIDR